MILFVKYSRNRASGFEIHLLVFTVGECFFTPIYRSPEMGGWGDFCWKYIGCVKAHDGSTGVGIQERHYA